MVRDLFNSFMCASQWILSSSIIPKYLTSFTLFITSLSILMLFRHPGITPFLLNMEYAVLLILTVSLFALNHMKIDNNTSFIFCWSVVALSAVTKTLLSSANSRNLLLPTAVTCRLCKAGIIKGSIQTLVLLHIGHVEGLIFSHLLLCIVAYFAGNFWTIGVNIIPLHLVPETSSVVHLKFCRADFSLALIEQYV